jgi:hypothetical protein
VADTCRSCGAPIEWAVTTKGKRIPLDPGTFDEGNIDVVDGIAYTTGQLTTVDRRRRSHFATCPNANQHRKRDRR